ncbi:LacI family DNA-binding transcriptional regulator [Rhizobium sp. PEPV16]|uniref:LacI family DNA-binding transcriptional regulator n=1 Tax=Rhizobium sp. PEPV16 TaxID=1820614 RepID=UPI00124DEF5E|nr:LacI family DNA-binding transcriptional regulator [Rhizobium sp. PEPV16]KAF5883713.1 LacI family DNA-binding transcriptional regulator [Rhizobium sp. PEPV16]
MKRATAQNVAMEAGVSKWTVIRAFTPGASITEASKAKVLEAAERLNYRPNLLARSLATNSTHQVAVLVDDFANPHKLPFLEKLTASLQAEGLVTMLININQHYNHVHAILNADQRQVDAIVLFGTAFRDEMLTDHKLGRTGPPMFVLARDSQIEGVPAISCDAVVAIAEIGKHLLERGYRRPGFMAGARTLSTALGRRRNFKEFWRTARGVELVEMSAERYSAEAGAQAARDYLSKVAPEDRIDVLMCENDALAFGAMDVARSEFGLRVPNDLAIVGFDNATPAASPAYGLTTYEQPTDQMVKAAIDMILERAPRETVNFKGKLVVRDSA